MNLLPARAEISCPLSILERVRIKEVFFTGNVLTGASYAQEQFEIYCERKNTEPASFKIIIFFFFFFVLSTAKGAWDSGEFWSKIPGFPAFFLHVQKIQEKSQERQECLGSLGFAGT